MENIISNFFSNFLVTYGSQIKEFIFRMIFDECVTVLQFLFSNVFSFVNHNALSLYSIIANYIVLTISNIKNKQADKALKVRCTHDVDINPDFVKILDDHNDVVTNIDSSKTLDIDNKRIIPDTFFDISHIDTSKITVDVPMVFHLLDPKLSVHTIDYWTNHINTKIVSQLNTDFNRNFLNYSNEYINNINMLFSNADVTKRNYYLNLVNHLPNNLNVTWNFSLSTVIMQPINNLAINNGDNDAIFKATTLKDPNSYLNIIVVPGSSILGIAVFPFSDRNKNDVSKIDERYNYRNAVLINTMPFLGEKQPYNKFRTFTHEIGHWCGLLHPFDNQTYKTTDITLYGLDKVHLNKHEETHDDLDQDVIGDMIADTATQTKPTFGTVYDSLIDMRKIINGSIVLVKKRNTPYSFIFEKNDNTPNFLNFMDYTDDSQMCMFTFGQIVKIIYMMSRFRPNFLTVDVLDKGIEEVVIKDIIVNEKIITNSNVVEKTISQQVTDVDNIEICAEQPNN